MTKMKITFIIAMCLSIAGCGRVERGITHLTGELTYKCSRNGVEYVQSDSGLAVSYNPDGKVRSCKK